MLRSASRAASALVFPTEGALQAIQPLLITAEGLYFSGGDGESAASLVSALGIVHPLRRLCDVRVLQRHAVRVNAGAIRVRLSAEFAAKSAERVPDPLSLFVEAMVSGLSARDSSNEFLYEDQFNAPVAEVVDQSAELEKVIRQASALKGLPLPSLCVLGRAWLLTHASTTPPWVHVRYQGGLLAMNGDYVTLKKLRAEWDAEISDRCKEAAAHFSAVPPAAESEQLRIARRELSRSGFVANGDLLFLATRPIRVGCVIPPHYNHALGQGVGKDLALTAPFSFPPGIPSNSELIIYRRGANGGWEAMPRAVCLGSVPSVNAGQGAAEAGINLLAFLRFGAIRIAANGRFHEHDGREE
jgi:hypothetical protein